MVNYQNLRITKLSVSFKHCFEIEIDLLINSGKSCWDSTIRDSFGIQRTSRFQNCPWFWILTNNCNELLNNRKDQTLLPTTVYTIQGIPRNVLFYDLPLRILFFAHDGLALPKKWCNYWQQCSYTSYSDYIYFCFVAETQPWRSVDWKWQDSHYVNSGNIFNNMALCIFLRVFMSS